MHLHQVIGRQYCNIQCTLRAQQEKLEEISYSGTLPLTLSMEDFEQHKLDDSCWFSPPFYTHTHGYKLCLKVYANGAISVKGTHISLYEQSHIIVHYSRYKKENQIEEAKKGITKHIKQGRTCDLTALNAAGIWILVPRARKLFPRNC